MGKKFLDLRLMNDETNKLIPEFRFPGFEGNEWLQKSLIDTTDKKIKWSFTGGPFGSNLKASDYTPTGIRIIQLQNIGDGKFINDYKIYTSKEKADELLSCNIYAGEIILSKMGDPVGRACIIPDYLARCVMASDGIRFVVDEKKYSKYFIYSLINSEEIRIAIEKKATGSTRKRIGLDELKAIELLIPNEITEQQKIADCLSSLDNLITAHTDKLEILKTYKKGLMQNLFPQEGEKVPKLRFKEFEKDGDWVEKSLANIAELTSSKRVHLADYVSSGIPFFRGKEISQLKSNNSPDDILFISNEHYNAIREKYGVPKTGDILITAVGTLANVYRVKNKDKFYFKDGNLIWMKNITINSNFLEILLDAQRENILASAIGSSQKALTITALNKLEFIIPKNPNEQEKIACCLSTLDKLIIEQAKKTEQLKLHKKGLMQGLFPKAKIKA